MSGGSYDYAFSEVVHFAERMPREGEMTPLRRAFREHLELVSEAMRAIELVDSGDCGEGDEEAAIRACLSAGAELEAAVTMAKEAKEELETTIALAEAQKGCRTRLLVADEVEEMATVLDEAQKGCRARLRPRGLLGYRPTGQKEKK